MYISIHQNNYSNPKYYGPQVFYSNVNSKNEKIAKTIQEDLNKFINCKITDVKNYDLIAEKVEN